MSLAVLESHFNQLSKIKQFEPDTDDKGEYKKLEK